MRNVQVLLYESKQPHFLVAKNYEFLNESYVITMKIP